METITPQAVKDYLVCPLYFDYKHIEKDYATYQKKEIYKERYLNVLRRVVSLFFYRRQAYDAVTYNMLVKRWEKLWFPKGMAYEALAYGDTNRHNPTGTIIHYNSMALAALERFFHLFSTDVGTPIVINEDRLVQVTDSLRIKAPIDLVLQYKDGSRRVVQWQVGTPRFGKHEQMLNFAAIYLAMKSDGFYTPDTTFCIYDFHEFKAKMRRIELTEEDVKRFIYWTECISNRSDPIPSRGFTPYCNSCPFDKQCKDYTSEMIEGMQNVVG